MQDNGYNSHVALIKDGASYSEVHAVHKNHDQLSKTVLIQLKKGQTVWIRLTNGSTYRVYGGGGYTTFAGYLISYHKLYCKFKHTHDIRLNNKYQKLIFKVMVVSYIGY